ncbi:hypothetical protein HK102_011687, partial [Quaeritorhiza haematococci]
MLEHETDAGALQAILAALGHQAWSAEAVSAAADRSAHPDPEVRDAVVHALMGLSDPRAIESLIELSRDPEPHVRDWATFALGSQIDDDTPAIREALAARLAAEDDRTRAEAAVGLALRGDRRVLPTLRDELASGRPMDLHVEAAALIAEPELHPLLLALRGRWDADPRGLEEASGPARRLEDAGSPESPSASAPSRPSEGTMATVERLGLEEIERRVCDVATVQLGVPRAKLAPGLRIVQDLHVDSLDLVELFMEVEEEFDVTLPDRSPDPVFKAVFTRPDFRLADLAELVYLAQGTGESRRDQGRAGEGDANPTAASFTQRGGRWDGRSPVWEKPLSDGGVTAYRRRSDGMRCLPIPSAVVELGDDSPDAPRDERPARPGAVGAGGVAAAPRAAVEARGRAGAAGRRTDGEIAGRGAGRLGHAASGG